MPSRRDLDVRRLEIAVDHAAFVCGVEGFRDWRARPIASVPGSRAAVQPMLERDAFDELQHQRADTPILDGVVDRSDAGMIQCRERSCFASRGGRGGHDRWRTPRAAP